MGMSTMPLTIFLRGMAVNHWFLLHPRYLLCCGLGKMASLAPERRKGEARFDTVGGVRGVLMLFEDTWVGVTQVTYPVGYVAHCAVP